MSETFLDGESVDMLKDRISELERKLRFLDSRGDVKHIVWCEKHGNWDFAVVDGANKCKACELEREVEELKLKSDCIEIATKHTDEAIIKHTRTSTLDEVDSLIKNITCYSEGHTAFKNAIIAAIERMKKGE